MAKRQGSRSLKAKEESVVQAGQDSVLENRIFLALLMIGMVITLFSGIANLFLRTPLERILPPFMIMVFLAAVFWYTIHFGRFEGPIILTSFLISLFLVPLIWTAHGGLYGGFPYYIPFLAVVLMSVHRGRLRWLFLSLLLASSVWMISLDLSGTTWIKPIADPRVLTYSNLFGLIGSTLGIIILFLLFTHSYVMERKRVSKMAEAIQVANRELEYLSRYDALTDLPNRRDMTEKMEYQIKLSNRSQQPFGLVMLDVDHFKKFNDRFGHQCGDFVLQALADLLLKIKREQDTVARWGGEEFLLLLPDTDLRGSLMMAERIRHAVEHESFHDGVTKHRITITAGATVYDHQSDRIDDYFRKADTALYWGKEQGRNRCYAYTNRMIELKEML